MIKGVLSTSFIFIIHTVNTAVITILAPSERLETMSMIDNKKDIGRCDLIGRLIGLIGLL